MINVILDNKVQKPGNLRYTTVALEPFRIALNNFNYNFILSYSLIFPLYISVPKMHMVWMVHALCLSLAFNTLKCTMATFPSWSLQVLQTALLQFH